MESRFETQRAKREMFESLQDFSTSRHEQFFVFAVEVGENLRRAFLCGDAPGSATRTFTVSSRLPARTIFCRKSRRASAAADAVQLAIAYEFLRHWILDNYWFEPHGLR